MKVIHWIFLILIIGLIGFGFYTVLIEKSALKECSNEDIATVIKKYRIRKKGHYINYEYTVNQKRINGSESINAKELEAINVGDTILILYSCDNPEISKLKRD